MNTTFLSEETTRYYEDMWVANQLKELSKGKYYFSNDQVFGKCKKEFWSIISNESWRNISFHFELSWKHGVPMTKADSLNILIHLETKKGHEKLYHKARESFESQGYVFKPDAKEGAFLAPDGSELKVPVTPDFSSEETAKQTIKQIIAVLESPAYQKCTKTVDEFISSLEK
ncbi:MAG: hypothetical protein MJ071_06370 [Oscillospiraceae bacterium]|nr:hypothetical protein [Oscillospiraceae bacterium]